MKNSTIPMNTKITDVALLGTSVAAGFSGMIHTYGAFAVTAGSAILFGIIRWQEHKQNMRIRQIEEAIKLRELEKQ